MIDRETIKPTEERLKNVLTKYQDILGVFYNANIFSLFVDDGKIHIEEACDDYYAHALTKDECNRLSEMFRDIAYELEDR